MSGSECRTPGSQARTKRELWKSDREWNINSGVVSWASATLSGFQAQPALFQWFRTSLRSVLHHGLPSNAPSVQSEGIYKHLAPPRETPGSLCALLARMELTAVRFPLRLSCHSLRAQRWVIMKSVHFSVRVAWVKSTWLGICGYAAM